MWDRILDIASIIGIGIVLLGFLSLGISYAVAKRRWSRGEYPSWAHSGVDPYRTGLLLLGLFSVCYFTLLGGRLDDVMMRSMANVMALPDLLSEFQDLQHPTDTELLSARNQVGEFAGHNQGCDFFIGEVREYDTVQNAVLNAYLAQQVSGHQVQVLFLDGGWIPSEMEPVLPKPLDDLAEWRLPVDIEQESLYMVYVIVSDYGRDQGLDCR